MILFYKKKILSILPYENVILFCQCVDTVDNRCWEKAALLSEQTKFRF